MGVNLRLTGSDQGDHETDLCTNGGYFQLCEWIESLGAEFKALAKLRKDGEFKGTHELADDINRAVESHPPSSADTLHVANRFADLLGDGDTEETASIQP